MMNEAQATLKLLRCMRRQWIRAYHKREGDVCILWNSHPPWFDADHPGYIVSKEGYHIGFCTRPPKERLQ